MIRTGPMMLLCETRSTISNTSKTEAQGSTVGPMWDCLMAAPCGPEGVVHVLLTSVTGGFYVNK